ncbi:universal stress protein [Defluviimonas sp. WL0024]|uniref:Universal stress protein n=1 Tax=Albidovulum salinarum TaxID=2984153 RepID=A0ABT2X9B5_9RHOB|nr:universal stress protein [Defluviimonas sp. WL0024]MCU9849607.1 universal stress protein [Defluviimonas sp. WL0024]
MTKNILCATDGTDHSEAAVIVAAELAQKYGAELTICTVNVAHGGSRGPLITHWTEAEVAKILDGAAAVAAAYGVEGVKRVDLISREAPAGIVSYAEQNGIDHIVMGTGDKRGISRLVLGSVAAEVSGRAHCSVTVAR